MLNFVSSAYGVAIRPDRFDDYLEAWDEWFDAIIDDAEAALTEVSPVIADALEHSDHLQTTMPGTALERILVPVVLLDAAGTVLALNSAATNLFSKEGLDGHRILSARTPILDAQSNSRHDVFRIGGGSQQRSFLAIETSVKAAVAAAYPAAQKALYLSLMDWSPTFAGELADRFNLTEAELRVARGLFEGRTAQEISGDVDRSLPTIRSHIKSLLQKTGTKRQVELVQFLSLLRQVLDVVPTAEDTQGGAGFEQIELNGPTGTLQVVRYGRGRPLLYFTTSSCPEETEGFRAALVTQGFAVTAPVRPGFRKSSLAGDDASDEMLDAWLDMLLAVSGPNPLVVGHREGGIIAARAVERLAARGETVAGLALLSTGAPVTALTQFDNTPASIRRSFVGAHVATPALRLGYQAARRLFHAGAVGQDHIIRFFHKDSPADRARLSDLAFYETTRDLLTFCFENTDQIVRDVALWGSDWSTTLKAARDAAPVLFVHGTAHVFHPIKDISALADTQGNLRLLALPDAGQMAIYEQPQAVAEALGAMT
ncbi:alpha/beta fold hydrolase [uncultured Tateyamaria sp.]|uniref:alpha/beta fold hydrolase n=1 Tax=Tateyamaria sp. 1078 TaxID=3417464 RepID=UPI00262386F8|nr:alpha/beta fold hydrolase [uncultured Tateyamaria sp.]